MQTIDLSNRSEIDKYNRMAHRENDRLAKAPLNQPDDYDTLKYLQQRRLQSWIRRTFTPYGRAHALNSYTWKHYFENDKGGFYITNGQFKGAMLAAGYQPTKATVNEINWRFRVKPIRDLSHMSSAFATLDAGNLNNVRLESAFTRFVTGHPSSFRRRNALTC